jgi:hypothetical protein
MTFVRWHQAAFKLHWARLSGSGNAPGRPAPPRLSEQARLFPRCHRQRFGWFQGIVRGRRHSLSLASWRRRVRSRWSSLRTWAFSAVRTGSDSPRRCRPIQVGPPVTSSLPLVPRHSAPPAQRAHHGGPIGRELPCKQLRSVATNLPARPPRRTSDRPIPARGYGLTEPWGADGVDSDRFFSRRCDGATTDRF